MKRRWFAVYTDTDEDEERLRKALRVLQRTGTLDLPHVATLDWDRESEECEE